MFFLPKIFKQDHLISMHGENGSEISAQCSAAREFGSVARENCCWAVKIPPAVRAIGESAWFEFTGSNLGLSENEVYPQL